MLVGFSGAAAKGENVTVNVEKTAGRDRTSAPCSTKTDDQVSRDGQDDRASRVGQDAKANRIQLISIASSVELPRGVENQPEAPRVKQ